MSPIVHNSSIPSQDGTHTPQVHALGSYRHDVAYTAALKSAQTHALGSYRHDVAYTAALKSSQAHALGNYRHDVAYTAALKSSSAIHDDLKFTGVEHCLAPVFFLRKNHRIASRHVLKRKGRVAC